MTRPRSSWAPGPRAPAASARRAARVSIAARTFPALRTSASGARRTGTDVHPRKPGQCDELYGLDSDAGVQRPDCVLAARRAPRPLRPRRPNTVYATFGAKGVWRSNSNGDPGQLGADLRATRWIDQPRHRRGRRARAEFDVVALPDGATRMYVGVGSGGSQTAKFFRSNSVRTGVATFTELTNNTSPGTAIRSATTTTTSTCRGRPTGRRMTPTPSTCSVQTTTPRLGRERRTAARSSCRPTQACHSQT